MCLCPNIETNISFTKRLQNKDLDVSIPSSGLKLCCASFSSNKSALSSSRSSLFEGMPLWFAPKLNCQACFLELLKNGEFDVSTPPSGSKLRYTFILQIGLTRKQSQNETTNQAKLRRASIKVIHVRLFLTTWQLDRLLKTGSPLGGHFTTNL